MGRSDSLGEFVLRLHKEKCNVPSKEGAPRPPSSLLRPNHVCSSALSISCPLVMTEAKGRVQKEEGWMVEGRGAHIPSVMIRTATIHEGASRAEHSTRLSSFILSVRSILLPFIYPFYGGAKGGSAWWSDPPNFTQ